MADFSDVSVSSSDSGDSDLIKPIKIKVNSPAVKPKLEKMILHNNGSSITQIKSSSSPHISRASSSLSLASSSLTSVGVEEVRHLSNNYEQLLHQATASIKKLKKEKISMESEQDRLLTVNIELATEVKRLLQLDKENKKDREVSSVVWCSVTPCNYPHTPGWVSS